MTVTAKNEKNTNTAGNNEREKKENRNVLLVGETGSGKSTLINTLFNFDIGVKWEDNVWFEIVDKEGRNQSESQTSSIFTYNIKEGEEHDFCLTLIDTPGFGDTRGTDGLLTDGLLELFSSDGGVSEIHAVGLVLKATENRLSDRMAYIFNSVTSLFGKNMEQDIVALFTHSDGRKPTNALHALEAAKIKCARDENNEPVYFLFDNCQREDRTEGTEYLKLVYETTMKSMGLFTEFLQKRESENLTETKDVLKARKDLTECIRNLQKQVDLITVKKKEIHQSQEAEKKYEQKMESNKNFVTEQTDIETVTEPINTYWPFFGKSAFNCKNCQETCYYSGKNQEVIQNGRCTACPQKCHENDHEKRDWRYVNKLRKVTKTNEQMKEIFKRNQAKRETKHQELNILQTELSDLEQTRNQDLDQAFNIIEHLEKIALNKDSVSTFVHLEFLIEKMEEKGDTEKVQKLERMRDRMDENIKTGATYLKIIK